MLLCICDCYKVVTKDNDFTELKLTLTHILGIIGFQSSARMLGI